MDDYKIEVLTDIKNDTDIDFEESLKNDFLDENEFYIPLIGWGKLIYFLI